jgi:hypothetical protein
MEKAYMNNMLKSLLVTALAISASHVSAYTNQNFLSSPRAQSASILLDSHVTRNLAQARKADRFGGNFLVSGFYSQSTNKTALGQYFGVNNKSSFKAATVGNAFSTAPGVDVNLAYLLHDIVAGDAAVDLAAGASRQVTVGLAPQTTSYGVEFAYRQCLGKILDGLHLSISLPVERVENNMNLSLTNPSGAGDVVGQTTKFLAGNLNYAAAAGAFGGGTPAVGSLKKALINGKNSATGIADIKAAVGYNFIQGGDWTAGLNIGFTVPTGNTPTGVNMFEAMYGNGGHWELGFGGAVDGFLWRDGDQSIELHASVDYRYGFQANETRTLAGAANWSQYFLLAVPATNFNAQTLNPTANVSTVPVSVTPNSSVRGNLGLEYDNGGFLFGINYAPGWRQAESVTFGGTFADNSVGIVSTLQSNSGAAAIFDGVYGAAIADNHVIGVKKADLSTGLSARPAQLSHRLGGNIGYTFRECEFPMAIGFGGHYELASDNASAENWAVNLTAGIGF